MGHFFLRLVTRFSGFRPTVGRWKYVSKFIVYYRIFLYVPNNLENHYTDF
jgi:hypothetical protein